MIFGTAGLSDSYGAPKVSRDGSGASSVNALDTVRATLRSPVHALSVLLEFETLFGVAVMVTLWIIEGTI